MRIEQTDYCQHATHKGQRRCADLCVILNPACDATPMVQTKGGDAVLTTIDSLAIFNHHSRYQAKCLFLKNSITVFGGCHTSEGLTAQVKSLGLSNTQIAS